jgi:hypothetical protein
MSNVLPLGHHVRVTVPGSGVSYEWSGGASPIPYGLSFGSASDLQVGQEVLVVVQGTVNTTAGSGSSSGFTPVGPAAISFTASSITLEPSQITGTVASQPNTSLSFTLATMPALFVPPSATPGGAPPWAPVIITVQTTTTTTFTNLTPDSLSGLSVNDVVSVKGWVFSTPSANPNVTVLAEAVVGRPGPMPLF